jgi:hypothetical protein
MKPRLSEGECAIKCASCLREFMIKSENKQHIQCCPYCECDMDAV